MSEGYRVAVLEEVESIGLPGQARWRPLRAELGVEAFGVNSYTAEEAGQVVIGEHDEQGTGADGHEELYLVVAGRAAFTVDGDEVDAPAGTLVSVPDPASKRGAVAGEPGTTVLVVGAPRGRAYQVAPWERNARVLRFWESEDWESAIAALEELHRETPDSAGILYNLACAEARAGRADDALEHLTAAVERFPGFAGNAQEDEDLVSIRDDPRFPAPPADA